MVGADVPSDSTTVIDSSVLIAMGAPDNARYEAFERYVTRRDITLLVPERVAEELGESPDAYAYQRDGLRAAREAGWAEPARAEFANPRVSEVVDKTRKRMGNLSSDESPRPKSRRPTPSWRGSPTSTRRTRPPPT